MSHPLYPPLFLILYNISDTLAGAVLSNLTFVCIFNFHLALCLSIIFLLTESVYICVLIAKEFGNNRNPL